MLTDLQPSPIPGLEAAGPSTSFLDHIPPEESPQKPSPRHPSPRRPARKSPRKSKSSTSTVVSGTKKVRSARRSSTLQKGKGKEKAPSRIIPSFETEVIPPLPLRVIPAFKTTMTMSQPLAPKVKPPAFVLPPPSPAAQLPPKESLLSNTMGPRLPKLDISSVLPGQPSSSGSSSLPDAQFDLPMAVDPPQAGPSNPKPVVNVPQTPSRRPFPMAKPLASHMIHAYSPVKPSPTHRLLKQE